MEKRIAEIPTLWPEAAAEVEEAKVGTENGAPKDSNQRYRLTTFSPPPSPIAIRTILLDLDTCPAVKRGDGDGDGASNSGRVQRTPVIHDPNLNSQMVIGWNRAEIQLGRATWLQPANAATLLVIIIFERKQQDYKHARLNLFSLVCLSLPT